MAKQTLRTPTPDVKFQRGDVVVLTGEAWPGGEVGPDPDVDPVAPLKGAIVVIGAAFWSRYEAGGIGQFLNPETPEDRWEWFAWPDRDHPYGATLIHRPDSGQRA